jgi:hypothetical protein
MPLLFGGLMLFLLACVLLDMNLFDYGGKQKRRSALISFSRSGMRNKKGERERNGTKHWIFHRT